jgi:SARP family transcriptional regulator, regulator of embCAB operon
VPRIAAPLQFRLLGELEVEGVPRSLLGGPKQRALLAYLLLHANEFVPRDRLVDAVWGESAPPTARSIVQGYIHKLRLALDETPAKIATRSGGYVLEVDTDELDARRFERLAIEGREALAAEDPERAQRLFERALALWRGEPLADLTYERAVEAEARRLSDLWLEATMDRIDAQIALGGDVPLLGELESLVSRHPLSERLRGQLMLAYYRAGRQAEALNTYRETRRLLVEELGLEPSAELRELERAILAQEVDG